MLKKIVNFIKYNNAFLIIIAFVFVASFSAIASSEKIITQNGIDNSQILNADLENFDLEMKVFNVKEDDENYYLDYQYKTYKIQENIWQVVLKQKQLEVSKKFLIGQDLGLYAQEELGEVINQELAHLNKIQENENKKGKKNVQETVEYKGLLGLVIDTKTRELPDSYEPVIEPVEIEYEEDQPNEPNEPEPQTPPVYIPSEVLPECNSSHLDLCVTEKLCEANGLHWYGEQCNDSGPTLDSVYCQNQKELCDEDNLFWCGQECETEEEEEEKENEEDEENEEDDNEDNNKKDEIAEEEDIEENESEAKSETINNDVEEEEEEEKEEEKEDEIWETETKNCEGEECDTTEE